MREGRSNTLKTIVAIAAIAAALSGTVAGYLLGQHNGQSAIAVLAAKTYMYEADNVESIYLNSDISLDEKVRALKHFVDFLVHFGPLAFSLTGEENYRADLAMAYTRIGLILRTTKKDQEADKYLQQAIALYPGGTKKVEDLIKLVQKTESQTKKGQSE